jgi:anti-anti-sigma factor
MALQIKLAYYNNNPLIRVIGMSDSEGIEILMESVANHFPAGFAHYYIDLSGVEYIDSMMISKILQLHLEFAHRGAPLVLLNLSTRVANVLVATGLDSVLHVETVSAGTLAATEKEDAV